MSESPNPKDTQALLQSMLQRLKLQPGKEGQANLHTPVHTTAAFTWGQDGERGASNMQKVSSGPVNGLEIGTNGIPTNEIGSSAADTNFGLEGEETQKTSHGGEVDRGLISFPSQRDSIDGDKVEDRVLGQAPQPGINLTGQLFPDKSLKDADFTSFERTDGARLSFGHSEMTRHIPNDKAAVTSMEQNQNQDQSFKPKVYVWSLKPTDANLDTKSQEKDVLHMGNGGVGASAQSKDMQIVAANSNSRRKQRSSENKTRRWTQKIKEKWRDRPGSFGKKGKGGGGTEDKKNEQGTKISVQEQLTAENVMNTSNKEEERTHHSVDSNDPSNTPPTHTEDGTNEGHMSSRSTSDFEFGLGSFSLLEEIVTGQEWGMFLNTKQSATSAYQRPSELKIPPNPRNSGQSSRMNQEGGVNRQCSFTRVEDFDFSMAQISPDAFQTVSMDLSEGRKAAGRDIGSAADQSEPMEHGHANRSTSSVQPAAILDNSVLKSRVHLNRKRQHQSAHRRDDRLQTISDEREEGREASKPLLSQTSHHMKEQPGESQRDDLMPLYIRTSSPPPLSPSSPFAPAPRGVLKHSISQDSQHSMETVTKRRRVEENRRVRFSEEVVAIAPPELNLDDIDSEEDWEEEEDSLIEQECEEEEEEIEAVAAPARRPSLPAWIQALKRMNTGRKHR